MISLNRMIPVSILGLLICFASVLSHAQITPDSPEIKITSLPESNSDVLYIRPPNSSGISVNRFSEFRVDDRELRIINIPTTRTSQTGDITVDAARLIVILADSIYLENHIELVGPAADILFLSPENSGYINCTACSIHNALRLSLATATPASDIDKNTAKLGTLKPGTSSSMVIDNLNAPGVIALDLITRQLSLSGLVQTHQRAYKEQDGSYRSDPSGNRKIGTGSTNLFLGPVAFDYDANTISSVETYSGTHTLSGKIYSSGVKISAAGDLVVNSLIDTRTDLLSSVSYLDNAFIPQEGITIQTFADGDLTISGSQRTSGIIDLKANAALLFPTALAQIEADSTRLIAGKTLTNLATVKSREINIAGDKVMNEGRLKATADLNMWAHKQLANQYGGHIQANTVRLVSTTQAVRNGSRTPYQSRLSETNSLFNFDDYLDHLNPIKLGAFYALNNEVNTTDSSLIMADSNSAHIIGNRIEISAKAFENINPYYEVSEQGEKSDFKIDYINQTSLSAENYLGVDAQSYVLNSSAHIFLNQSNGLIEVNTGLLNNERYRVVNSLSKPEVIRENGYVVPDLSYLVVVGDETLKLSSKLLVSSPPGIIAALGEGKFITRQGMLNNTSYIEFYGGLRLDSPSLHHIGLNQQSYTEKFNRTYLYLDKPRKVEEKRISTPELKILTEIDSLFLIHGGLAASTSMNHYRNHQPIDGYIDKAIESIANNELSGSYISDTDRANIREEAKKTGEITVNGKKFSLYEKLVELYEQAKESIANILSELSWWSK